MNGERDILNIDEAAELLGVSVKTFNKVLHSESLPGRKIGREWKFSRRALIEWVGSGQSAEFYRDTNGKAQAAGERAGEPTGERGQAAPRRNTGWRLALD